MPKVNIYPEYYLNVLRRGVHLPVRVQLDHLVRKPLAVFNFGVALTYVMGRYLYQAAKYSAKFQWKVMTARRRLLPNFLIIGVQKCGTTSLYRYLTQHPDIESACKKEIKYFDLRPHKSLNWYRAHFPLASKRQQNLSLITGEAGPDYILFPDVANHVARTLPQVKLIAIFRNPVDRAYSQYRFSTRRGYEFASFEEALRQEPLRLKKAKRECLKRKKHLSQSTVYRELSYRRRGLYAQQLKVWIERFPKRNIWVLCTEELNNQPDSTLEKVTRFLGVSEYNFDTRERHHQSPEYSDMSPMVRRDLVDYFKPHNQKLYSLVGRSFDWDS
jgi:hypothetical protein